MKSNEIVMKIIEYFHGKSRGNISDFSKKTGITTGTIAGWIKSENFFEPSNKHKRKICEIYGISRDWLDTGVGDMLRNTAEPQIEASTSHELTPVRPVPVSKDILSDFEALKLKHAKLEGKLEEAEKIIDKYMNRLEKALTNSEQVKKKPTSRRS